MNNDNSQKESFTNSKVHLFLSVSAFLGIMFLAGYIGTQFQEIEEKLQYNPPVIHSHTNEINYEKGQSVYVPAYSHIYSGDGEPKLLAITISIRNTDPDRTIRVVQARYYDTKGELVKNFVDGIIEIAPLETVDILVGKHDKRGGSGANFIITWKSDEPVYEPIIEAVMIGLSKDHDISFISSGRPLAERIEK